MSYQAIARKYRPQTFADLTGQEHITRTLGNALDQQRLHHAYLFSGARGTGKTTSARILAKGLNCHHSVTSQPCLKCASCTEIAIGNSIDVLEIDAASNTGVDNVRDVIINNIAVAPARDRYKVFVIDEVHMLSNSAFNALLKTLEEPPSHVVFIMATTELHKVPDTILSRCQQFEFRHIPADKMVKRLREIASAETVKISDEALREIARAGAGSLRDALSAFDQVIAFSGNEIKADDVTTSLGLAGEKTLLAFTEAIAAQDSAAILNLVEELDSRGYDLRNFTRELMAYLRHLLVIRSGITSQSVLGLADVEIEALKKISTRFSEEDLVRFFHLLAETEKAIKDSPHPRFQLETGLIKLTHTARLRSLTELITRLEALTSGEGGRVYSSTNSSAATTSSIPAKTSTNVPAAPVTRSIDPPVRPAPAPKISAPPEPDFPPMAMDEPPDFADASYNPFESSAPAAAPRGSAKQPSPSTYSPAPQVEIKSSPMPAITDSREVELIRNELERLNRTALVTALEDAQNISYGGGKLVVTFAGEDIFAKRLRDSSRIFQEIGQTLFGQPIAIEVITSKQKTARADEVANPKSKLREEAMNNPAVRMLVEKFRGEVVDVREISSESKTS